MGASYDEMLRQWPQAGMKWLVETCKALLPEKYRHRPYRHPELKNGTGLLHTEDGLNAYMAAYGEMHVAKCKAALQNFPFDKLNGAIEIVDWGCGQGIGSLCVLKALTERDKLQWVKRVSLIEPSQAALGRAVANATAATGGGVTVAPFNFYLPGSADGDVIAGLDYSASNVIHVFSNILDVGDIDLAKLAGMVPRTGHQHYVLCMGPLNANAYRIDLFCKIFGVQTYFSDLEDSSYGRTSDTFYLYTCKTKCFSYDGSPLDPSVAAAYKAPVNRPVYSEYDPQLAVQNGIMSEDLKRLYLILLNKSGLTDDDFIILQPDIRGDRPDIVIVRPGKGVLLINLVEEDLNECKKKNDDTTTDKKDGGAMFDLEEIIVGGTDVVKSPLLAIKAYQENLLRLHLESMVEKIIADSSNWKMVQKMLLFTKNTQDEINDFFKDVKRHYTLCYGKEFFTNAKKQAGLLYASHMNEDNPLFDDKTLKSFLHIIRPNWHSYKEGKIINLSASQRSLAASVAGKRQKISGVAGSGKTQVLATRAVNAQIRTGKRVLILTYNKSLVNFMRYRLGEIRADFPWDKFVISYYHSFFRVQANSLKMHVGFSSYDDENFFKPVEDKTERFSAIFIDEVQDYLTQWLRILNDYFLEKGGEFVVFGDPKQNIFNRELDANGDIRLEFISGTWNHELKERQRFANPQLARLATTFQTEFYNSEFPADVFKDTLRQASVFNRMKYENLGYSDDIEEIGGAVRRVIEENKLIPKDTVILSQTKDILRDVEHHYLKWSEKLTTTTFSSLEQYKSLLELHGPKEKKEFESDNDAIENNKKLNFTTETDNLKMSTIHSFKGWESPNVIFILEPEISEPDGHSIPIRMKYTVKDIENAPELIYTAITRAKENLFIINLGNAKYHDFFASNTN